MALNITSGIADIPQGGTNAGTASGARVNLLPSLATNAGKVLAVNAGATDVEFIPVAGGGGTVTSVGLSMPAIFSVANSPITTNGTLTVTYSGTALPVANGGTGATTAANARTGLGATTVGSNLFTLTNPTAITFLRVNADNTVSTLDAAAFRTAIGAGTSSTVGTVTSVGGTGTVSGLTLSGTITASGNLTLGGTLAVTASNFASQTANTFLAAPNGAAGVPTFRTIVAADVPTLNQSTTGTAANVTGTVAIANGGTGATTAGAALTALGAQAALVSGTNIKTVNSTSLLGSGNIVISGGIAYTRITTATTLTNNQGVIADTTGGVFTITLPATPASGNQVWVADGGNWATNNLTIDPNGATIEGFAADENLVCNVGGVELHLLFDGTRWNVHTMAGGQGGTAGQQGVEIISTNTTAVAYTTYVLISSLTLTLPVSPTSGNSVTIINRSGTETCVVGRNSQNIMGLAENLTIDSLNTPITLTFADSTRGWVLS